MFRNLLLMLMLGVFSSSANAGMVLVGLYDGLNDGDATQLEAILNTGFDKISGGALGLVVDLQEEARVDVVDLSAGPESSGGLTITGTMFKPVPDSTEAIVGTWDWTGAGSLDYLTFKFDSWLAVYQITDGMTSGVWSTQDFCDGTVSDLACNANGQPFALSHSAAYGVVPVPAAVWLFASGLLGLVGVARKRV